VSIRVHPWFIFLFTARDDDRQRDGNQQDGGHDQQRDARGYFNLKPLRIMLVGIEQHFCADEGQHDGQANFQITEVAECADEEEYIERRPRMAKTFEVKTMRPCASPEKTAGTESTAKIKSWFPPAAAQRQRREGEPAAEPREKLLAVEICATGKNFPHQPQHGIFFRPAPFPAWRKHFRSGKNEERAEDVKHPVKLVDERRAGGDHRAAHHERAKNAPEEQPVLIFRRHAEPGKRSAMTRMLSSESESSMT